MKTADLMAGVTFRDTRPNSEPLYFDVHGRILRFSLKPGQKIEEHSAPDSPFYAIVLSGEGYFSGGDGVEQLVRPNSLLVFAPGEDHTVRAEDEELVFIGILHGVPSTPPGRVGGTMVGE